MAVRGVKPVVAFAQAVPGAIDNVGPAIKTAFSYGCRAFVWASGINNLQEIERKHFKNHQMATRAETGPAAPTTLTDGEKILKRDTNWKAKEDFVRNTGLEVSALALKWSVWDQIVVKSILPQSGLDLALSVGSKIKNNKTLQEIAKSVSETAVGVWNGVASLIPSSEGESSYWSYVPPVAIATLATYKGVKGLWKTFKATKERPRFASPEEYKRNRSKNWKALIWHSGQLTVGAIVGASTTKAAMGAEALSTAATLASQGVTIAIPTAAVLAVYNGGSRLANSQGNRYVNTALTIAGGAYLWIATSKAVVDGFVAGGIGKQLAKDVGEQLGSPVLAYTTTALSVGFALKGVWDLFTSNQKSLALMKIGAGVGGCGISAGIWPNPAKDWAFDAVKSVASTIWNAAASAGTYISESPSVPSLNSVLPVLSVVTLASACAYGVAKKKGIVELVEGEGPNQVVVDRFSTNEAILSIMALSLTGWGTWKMVTAT